MKYAVYLLTCKDDAEASHIATELLSNKLAACVKKMPINSSYMWKGELCHDDEVMLMIESSADVFKDVQELLDTVHSYDQYVLTEIEVSRTNPGVLDWIQENVKSGGR